MLHVIARSVATKQSQKCEKVMRLPRSPRSAVGAGRHFVPPRNDVLKWTDD